MLRCFGLSTCVFWEYVAQNTHGRFMGWWADRAVCHIVLGFWWLLYKFMYVCVIWYVVYAYIDICVDRDRGKEKRESTAPYLNHVSSTSSSCRSTSLPPSPFPPLQLLLSSASPPSFPYLARASAYASASSWATMYSSSDNPSTYQTGILWPHQSCREMHQGRILVSLGCVCTWKRGAGVFWWIHIPLFALFC